VLQDVYHYRKWHEVQVRRSSHLENNDCQHQVSRLLCKLCPHRPRHRVSIEALYISKRHNSREDSTVCSLAARQDRTIVRDSGRRFLNTAPHGGSPKSLMGACLSYNGLHQKPLLVLMIGRDSNGACYRCPAQPQHSTRL